MCFAYFINTIIAICFALAFVCFGMGIQKSFIDNRKNDTDDGKNNTQNPPPVISP